MTTTTRAIVLSAMAALAVGACTSETDPAPDAGVVATAASPAPPATAEFGQDFAWDDGLALSVHGPAPFTPSTGALVAGDGVTVLFTLTVRNESSEPWDPSMLFASLRAGDAEATPVFDADSGVGDMPDAAVPPLGELRLRLAFAVAREGDLVLRVTPGPAYVPAVFAG
jgi:hypothetical protein